MEMKNNRGRFEGARDKHMVFFPHGFIDPLTGARMTRLYFDRAHWEKVVNDATEKGMGVRPYLKSLLKDKETPFAGEASDYIQRAGRKEYATADIGIPYLIRIAEKTFHERGDHRTFEGWAELFSLRDDAVLGAVKGSFKGAVDKVERNPKFESDNALLHFSEFIEFLAYRFVCKGQNSIALSFSLQDGVLQLAKVE